MNVGYAVIVALLTLGVAIQLLCSIGVFFMRDAYAKLHYLGPASTVSIFLIAVAVIVQNGFTQSSVKVVMLALIILISSPVISHATARAAKVRSDLGFDDEPGSGGE